MNIFSECGDVLAQNNGTDPFSFFMGVLSKNYQGMIIVKLF